MTKLIMKDDSQSEARFTSWLTYFLLIAGIASILFLYGQCQPLNP